MYIITFVLFCLCCCSLSSLAAPQAKPSCSSDIVKLVNGINRNIDAQRGERFSVDNIGVLIAVTDAPPDQLAPAKTKLLGFIDQGIQIRKENQVLGQGTKAQAGLAKVENAQGMELQLAQTITGNKTKDTETVRSLQMMFDGGIQQNMQNIQDATADCTPFGLA